MKKGFSCKSGHWMITAYDERVPGYQKIKYGNYIVKLKDDVGLEDEVKKVNTMPLHLGAFLLSNSKRAVENFIHAKDGFYTNDFFFIKIRIVFILKTNNGKNLMKLE